MIPVIIPHYQNTEQLQKCIAHLHRQTLPPQIFIRDNTHHNVYFTAAINEGLRQYLTHPQVHYFILLNQDMYLNPNAVAEMVKFMDSHPQCGIGTPLQLHYDKPDYVVCAGGLEAFPFGKHLHGPLPEFTQDLKIAWGNGACMILRKTMVQEIGLFDENLVFIGSDSDYCFTARSRGWQVWSMVQARGVHELGVSSEITNSALEMLKLKDMIYFADKWLTGNLYRRLAHEHQVLTPEQVLGIEDVLKHSLERLQTQLQTQTK